MEKRCILYFLFFLAISNNINAQIPVELFAGNERATVDILFFKFFKDKKNENTPWLFFNRNRASVDYRITKTNFLPQFGFTEAISYNHKKLKGFAPVVVAQILSWKLSPKAGIQYVFIKNDITLFSWVVCETLKKPDLDYFILFRYTPKLSKRIRLFTQFESVNGIPTDPLANFNLTQRIRIGIQLKSYQMGAGVDLSQNGKQTFLFNHNLGGFIRHEF